MRTDRKMKNTMMIFQILKTISIAVQQMAMAGIMTMTGTMMKTMTMMMTIGTTTMTILKISIREILREDSLLAVGQVDADHQVQDQAADVQLQTVVQTLVQVVVVLFHQAALHAVVQILTAIQVLVEEEIHHQTQEEDHLTEALIQAEEILQARAHLAEAPEILQTAGLHQ